MSSFQDMSSLFSEEDFRLLQNSRAAWDCVTPAFNLTLSWGCKKNKNETFEEFLKKKTSLSKSEKKLLSDNPDKMSQTNSDNFDVTFIYSLIPFVCNNVAQPGTEEHKLKLNDHTSLEYLLREAKKLRNDLFHEKDKAVSVSIFKDMNKAVNSLIIGAADAFGIPESIKNDKVSDMDFKFFNIAKKSSNPNWFTELISMKLKTEALDEMKDVWKSKHMNIYVPLRDGQPYKRTSVYSTLKITSNNIGDENERTIFSADELLSKRKDITILVGSPGSGKTTFLKHTVDKLLEKNCSSTDSLEVTVFIACRTSENDSIGSLLKEKFPKSTSLLPDQEIGEAASQLSICFLMDGYDEASESSVKLLWNIIERSCNHSNWSFVISTRYQSLQELTTEFYKREMCFKVIHIEPISTLGQKKLFLERYSQADSINLDIEDVFQKISKSVQAILDRPSILSLFYSLLVHAKDDIRQFKNEIDLFNSILDLMKQEILHKIKSENPNHKNPEIIVEKLLKSLQKLALEMFLKGKYNLVEEEYNDFIESLLEKTGLDMSYRKVLSSVFSADGSYHQFWHSSLQEFFGALHVLPNLVPEPPKPVNNSRLSKWIRHGFEVVYDYLDPDYTLRYVFGEYNV